MEKGRKRAIKIHESKRVFLVILRGGRACWEKLLQKGSCRSAALLARAYGGDSVSRSEEGGSPPSAQQILATRQRVVKIFALLKSNALFNAFLREEGGTRMRDGRSLRAPRFSLALLQLLFPSYALSLSRLRRQLPPGGSLSTKHSALFACLLSPHRQ